MIIKTTKRPAEGMTLKPINIREELQRIEEERSAAIQLRIEKFGETPDQAAKAYDDIRTKLFNALLPIALKRASSILRALK